MDKTVRFDIEGTIIELPMKFDERSQKYLEDYREVIENPVRTRRGDQSFLHSMMPAPMPRWWTTSRQAWNAAPVGISGILPAHCWVCATTKKMRSGAKIQDIKFGAEEE